MQSFIYAGIFLLSLLYTVTAQTFTSCNPLNTTDCPLDTALGVSNYSIDLTQSSMSSTVWNQSAGTTIVYGNYGAEFTINEQGNAPTVNTNFYIFFGQVEIIMKAASGTGIISSIVLLSDDLDEIDIEFMGGNTSFVETNYFGKGNTTSYDRATYYPVDHPMADFHNYTIDWNQDRINWLVDGNIIRTLKQADADDDGNDFPQTPCQLKLGIWSGGDPTSDSNGTIEWAGGLTDFSKAPFTMTVQSIRVTDAHTNVTQYKYGDETGKWQGIQSLNTTKAIKLDGNNSQSNTQSLKQKWNGLSHTNKIIVASCVLGFVAIALIVFTFCCFKQRRAGKKERLLGQAEYDKQTSELLAYRREMSRARTDKLMDAHHMQSMNMGGMSGLQQEKFPSVTVSRFMSPTGYSPNSPLHSPYGDLYANSQYAQSTRSFGGRGGGGYAGGYQRF